MEIKQLLEDLREKYKKAQEKYGSQLFDTNALEKRILVQTENKGDINSFARQENQFFTKALEIARKQELEEKEKSIRQKRMHDILVENRKKIEKYNDSNFHPKASFELKRIIGASSNYYNRFCKTTENYFQGTSYGTELKQLFFNLGRYHYQTGGSSLPAALQDYIAVIESGNTHRTHSWEQTILQTIGNTLHRIHYIFTSIKQEKATANDPFDEIIQAVKYASHEENWNDKPLADFVNHAIDNSRMIIQDFRLDSLVKQNKPS